MTYLTQVWSHRHFWMSLVRMDLRTRYRRSVLGIGWSLLQPLAMSAILCLVFSQWQRVSWHVYVPHLLTGNVCWAFIVGCALQGCQSYYLAESYIRQCPLPIAIYPLRTAIGAAFHLAMGLTTLILITGFMLGLPPVAATLSLLPTLAMLVVFGWALAVLFASANVFFNDTQHLAEVGFQLLFFLTPIIYRLEDMKDNPHFWLWKFNPFVYFLTVVRAPLLHHTVPSVQDLLPALGITVAASAIALALLRKLQVRLIFYL